MNNTYLQLCTEYYDLTKPCAPEVELSFYLDYAQKAGGFLLEPMCGTGRFLIPMLEHGFDVEGFDSSVYMLELLQQKCKQKNLTASISRCFLQEFTSDKRYNLIFIPSGSFGLITSAQQVQECLRILYNHLAPGGKFVFEVDTPMSLHNYPLNSWHKSVQQKNDSSFLIFNQFPVYDSQSHIFEVLCNYEHLHNGNICATETENFSVKLYEAGELDSLLHSTGFSFIIYNNYHKKVDTASTIIIYECTK